MRIKVGLILFLGIFILSGFGLQVAFAQQPVVHAVLFFSPTCPHCQKVMHEVLPPISQKYGDKLDIAGIDVSQEVGAALYQSAAAAFKIPDDRLGVPTLVVGKVVLVGSDEIANQLSGLIDQGLSSGGVDWPVIPGLKEIMASQPQSPSSPSGSQEPAVQVQPAGGGPIFLLRFAQDPVANSIAIVVLLGMIVCLVITTISFIKGSGSKFLHWPKWIIPLLSVLGMVIAIYLSYIELTKSHALCGPIGNCDTVQTSSYAFLFGVIPIGVLGLLGYVAILAAWLIKEFGPQTWAKFLSLAIWGMAWFGVLFSIYLTFLEPFVIGATCMYCITSAIIMTLILLGSTEPAKEASKIDESEYEDLEVEDAQEGEEESEEPGAA